VVGLFLRRGGLNKPLNALMCAFYSRHAAIMVPFEEAIVSGFKALTQGLPQRSRCLVLGTRRTRLPHCFDSAKAEGNIVAVQQRPPGQYRIAIGISRVTCDHCQRGLAWHSGSLQHAEVAGIRELRYGDRRRVIWP
jgi:hypothetical protein